MRVLGIETSCDETSAAIVDDGRAVRSSIIFSQIDLHGPYGGVVPEIASRSHVKALPLVIQQSLDAADCGWDDIDRIAVTYGPGLASSLLVGLAHARGLSRSLARPLVGVNHLHAHIHSPFLTAAAPDPASLLPYLALVVSGGHTCLVRVEAPGRYKLLGQTVDDAAGEAFDKGANLLRLGYPGGPVMDRLGKLGRPDAIAFPRGKVGRDNAAAMGMDSRYCFSFSGLKTSLMYHLRKSPIADDEHERLVDVIASYQEAIVDALITRTAAALDSDLDTLVVGGGVSLNSRLRARLALLADQRGVRLLTAEPKYCGDNAAMIAGLAGMGEGRLADGEAPPLDAVPNLPIATV
jgi:N6-L-threonylcarbamoyladenine synthase